MSVAGCWRGFSLFVSVVDASSPSDLGNEALFSTFIFLFLSLIFFEPDWVSFEDDVFGYGIGTGPAEGEGGVLATSGGKALVFPPLCLLVI